MSSCACVISVCSAAPIFRPAETLEVVSAPQNFMARGPMFLRLHDGNQGCRAKKYWPACRNLRVPYLKCLSCKWALRNIILKYKTENLTKIILLFCPVRKIINLYKICFLMLRKKILQNKTDNLTKIIWSSSIKKTGYIENVSKIFYKRDNIIIAETSTVLIGNNK